MDERKRFGSALIAGGVALILAAILTDFIGIEHSRGIGRVQLVGVLVGVAAGVAGYLLGRGKE